VEVGKPSLKFTSTRIEFGGVSRIKKQDGLRYGERLLEGK
jgi:hypothetical protein